MKMVLIPESEYRRLKPEGGMKDKTNKILRGKRDKKSAIEMTQLFGRYLRTTKPEKEIQSLTKEEIVENLPPIYHEKVTKFLTQLQTMDLHGLIIFNLLQKMEKLLVIS